ncbi:MAG TPA: hypothetical protein VK654_08105 [Nitrospirota bacterium]|nr:hypothetical protein [Nitrospirota bacterium]
MRHTITILLTWLIVGLLVQNTCPRGFGGKTTVAASSSSSCSHCQHTQTQKLNVEGSMFSSISRAPAHMPMFVLDIPNTQPAFRLVATASPRSVIPNTYKNTAPNELLHPPRA